MHLAVLASTDSWYFRDLCRAAESQHQLTAVSFTQLCATISGGESRLESHEFDFRSCDAVLVRTMPPGSLEQVVFRMNALGRLAAEGTVVLNPPRSLEIAIDKYLTLAKLRGAGLNVPRTCVCQTWEQAMEAFVELGSDVVVKPLFGSEGRGLVRVTDEGVAWRTFKTLQQLQAVIYLQEFIEHAGLDIRILTIGDESFAIRRQNLEDWRTNVSRGATTEPHALTDDLRDTAQRATAAVNAPLAGVDVLSGRDGKQYVIEVNAVPGWKATARTLETDIAKRVLRFIESSL